MHVKRLFFGIVFSLCASAMFGEACAQTSTSTLSASLLAEDASAIAREARRSGDSVRGAILYAQKKLNCSGCHAQGSTDLLGPDLTRRGENVDDSFFVESILTPSKVITKGFDSVRVLTVDGRALTGRVIGEDAQQVILRDTSQPSRLRVIPRGELEQIVPSTKSAMPDGLADQLEDRQQFLDLVKYLMDISATSPALMRDSEAADPAVTVSPVHPSGGVVDDRIKGLALIDHFGCAHCHAIEAASGHPLSKKRAPNLSSSTTRIDSRYLQRFIADPLHVKPGTSMPDSLGTLTGDQRRGVAEAITHYLLTLTDKPFQSQASDPAAAARGGELFHSIGCVACHSPRNEQGQPWLDDDSVALGPIAQKYSLDGLVSFLSDPHSVRPSGRMPNMSLTHWEAIDLANYLLRGNEDGAPADDADAVIAADPALASAGKRYFTQYQCARCHEPDAPEVNSPLIALDRLDPQRGCVSGNAGSWPRYQLDASQIDLMRIAIEQAADDLTDEQQIKLTMQTLRCFHCHQRDGVGGVRGERDDFFLTDDPNLGPQGRLPPSLTGVGAKLKPQWMRQVLVSGRVIRPYVKTRMPQYGAANVTHLVDLFQRVDVLPTVEHGNSSDIKETKKIGVELAGSGGLNCIACHTFQQKRAQTMNAVDLTEMAERLHRDWFYRYMKSPQVFNPNTVMPSFWPGGKAIRQEILGGNTTGQIEALWVYLSDGRQARVPRGLIQEPMELLAGKEAVMLRRSYQGIGKRGIGVGLPGGLNFAYDAAQMRLAMIWKGKFADPGGVWRGQGSGRVRPLGGDLQSFSAGSELEKLQLAAEAVVTQVDAGGSPNRRFTGYFLDELQRPTFTYRYAEVEVQDRIVDFSNTGGNPHGDTESDRPGGDTILRRTLRFDSPGADQDFVFRIGTDQEIVAEGEHVFRFGRSLRIRVDRQHRAKIVAAEKESRLIIPLAVRPGQSSLVLDYVW